MLDSDFPQETSKGPAIAISVSRPVIRATGDACELWTGSFMLEDTTDPGFRVWNAKQHPYEELRDVVMDVLIQRIAGNNQFNTLVEHTARDINQRESSNVDLGTGIACQFVHAAVCVGMEEAGPGSAVWSKDCELRR